MLLQPLIAIAICVLQNSSRSLLLLQLKQQRYTIGSVHLVLASTFGKAPEGSHFLTISTWAHIGNSPATCAYNSAVFEVKKKIRVFYIARSYGRAAEGVVR
jgi:hypothetical protein